MAELVFRDMIKKQGIEKDFFVASSATSTEEIGNPIYPPARAELAKHGLSDDKKRSVQLSASDYDGYDLFVGMDDRNIRNMHRIFGGDPNGKIVKLMDFTARGGEVADPWYTGDFEATYRDVVEGCERLLRS
jgi:protein-tyrosine phosphatase